MPETGLIALAGNPNVGKSTIFNMLTGLNQHTGNWSGKTVELFEGTVCLEGQRYTLVDLPGMYSLRATSKEEEVARDYLLTKKPSVTVCVVDSTCLERNLSLVFQILSVTKSVIVCLNFMDEVEEQGIQIDVGLLSQRLGVPVVAIAARNRMGISQLEKAMAFAVQKAETGQIANGCVQQGTGIEFKHDPSLLFSKAEAMAGEVTNFKSGRVATGKSFTEKLDDIVTSRVFGIPIMIALLGMIFCITIFLANYPSMLLGKLMFQIEELLSVWVKALWVPVWFHDILILGAFRTCAWVVSVMLPPMAIFFPLFTLLEDFGYLPRVAFNLDHLFKNVGGHGKQALTMSMGFGCNAAGVIACRIIESPRERLIAILTNCFVPCNGRFPTLIMLSALFFGGSGVLGVSSAGAVVMGLIIVGILVTLGVSRFLTNTMLKGVPSSFVLELPPYRKPDLSKVLIRSFKDRTVFVLKRAIVVAIPCGIITWLLANSHVGGASVLSHMSTLLNPVARVIGMDGVILMAFILGFPANEIVLPIALMSYLSQSVMMEVESLELIGSVLVSNGWGWTTALSVMLFSLLHFPCGTTVYTIYKETGKAKWAVLSVLLPTVVSFLILATLNLCFLLV